MKNRKTYEIVSIVYLSSGLRRWMILLTGILLFPYFTTAEQSAEPKAATQDDMLIQLLEEKLAQSFFHSQSVPVALSGEVRLKAQFHSMIEAPEFMSPDWSWLQSGWEGNEGLLRLAFGARIGRYGTITGKIGFYHTFTGDNELTGPLPDGTREGFVPVEGVRDRNGTAAYIHEDLGATIDFRSGPVPFELSFGGVQWIEMSPLTVWEHQPRLFAWEYLPFEILESVGMFYYKNMVTGERTGRVAWNKKPFNGIGVRTKGLPWQCGLDFFFGSADVYDRLEREYIDLQGERSYYADTKSAVAGQGIGDTWRHTLLGRFTKSTTFGNKATEGMPLTVGMNIVHINYDTDVLYTERFSNGFFTGRRADSLFCKEPLVASVDVSGKTGSGFGFTVECAVSRVDTIWLRDTDSAGRSTFTLLDSLSENATAPAAALYVHLENNRLMRIKVDLFCAMPGLYSPFSLAPSLDGFYPFGANCAMPGKFAASKYTRNMAGFDCSLAPWDMKNNGHCRFLYGNSAQVEPGPDVIYFPYRLNGPDLFTLFQSSYTRWGYNLIDNSDQYICRYEKRLGDESFRIDDHRRVFGPEAGGLRSDFLSMYESFVPYTEEDDAIDNLSDHDVSVFKRSSAVRSHRKYSVISGIDAAYNISSLIGWKRVLYFSMYATVNGIARMPMPVPLRGAEKDHILWGAYVRSETGIGITSRLYLLLLAGWENWYAYNAWMKQPVGTTVRRVPIDYHDFATGIGCDWQLSGRAGLHIRCKRMKHVDGHYPANNWDIPLVSTELKMWF